MFLCFAIAVARAIKGEPASSFPALARAAERLERPLYFVVDDFHLLADTCAEAELEQLISLSSPNLRFLVGSRRSPHLNLARSELQTVLTVGGDDLRFRIPEIDELFRNTYRQPLSPDGVSNLAQMTEGWAAALHLFHLATKNRPSAERRRSAESLGATSRFARDYLTHHFLAGISAEMEELLRVSCLLEVLTPSRCDALLDRNDSRVLLQQLEELGVLSMGDDGAAFRTPKVLRQYLLAGLSDAGSDAQGELRQRTAAILEQEGAVGAGLQVLAEGNDWKAVGQALRRAGTSAVLPGMCRWAASLPDSVMRDDAWTMLARSRQMVDDGLAAAAERAAARVPELTADTDCRRLARDIGLTAAVWAGGAAPPSVMAPSWELRNAVHSNPCVAAARSLANQRHPGNMLAAGLSLLVAGDQKTALPLLIVAAERPGTCPGSALAAQLVLAVFGHDNSGTASGAAATEVDAVLGEAERRGLTWLCRLAHGIQAALRRTPAGFKAVDAVIAACEDRGDEWGAALVAAAAALIRLRAGATDLEQLEALALRFRRLSAGTLEAWARSAQALVAASLDIPGALDTVQTAEAFARAAAVPGALAIAYAAMALQEPDEYEELMRQATQTGQSAGLLCRPWTWLLPKLQRGLPGRMQRAGATDLPPSARREPSRTEAPCRGARLPSLDVACFSAFALRRDGVAVDLAKIRPQARTVLRILSLNAGRLVHREKLAGILWPDLDPPAALHALQVSVSCLRGALQPEGTSECPQLLARQGEAYALVLGTGSTFDLADFDDALYAASKARSAGDNLGAAVELRRAVELYTGEVLPEDGPAEWAADTRERYRMRAAEAAASLAGVEFGLGNPAAAAAAATRSVEIDPWRDESWRTLVETFRQLGDPAAAERAQRRYDVMLNSLGVPAGPDRTTADNVTVGLRTESPRQPRVLPPVPTSRGS
jgi:DNA-binding SARP family transcriptional activator